MLFRTTIGRAALLTIALGMASDVHANAILNGGFEDAQFADWITNPASTGSLLFEGGSGHSGHSAAWFGAVGPIADSISQSFSTAPGHSYVLDFWLAHAASDTANAFTVLWDGIPVLSLVNANKFGYREYTFVSSASGSFSTIAFSGLDMLSYFRLDDVNVTPTPNPEPATLLLLGTGVALLRWRRRRASPDGYHSQIS